MRKRRRPKNRIVILGWYGSDNTGDEAVLQAVVEALRRRGFDDLCALSVDPAKTATRLGVQSAPRNPFSLGTLKALWGAQALVLGGGGLIQDGTSLYNLPLYALHVALARLFGLKVIAWGLGVEPVTTLLGKLLARFMVRAADHFSVRDTASLRLLRRAGVPTDQVKITGDPAFLISPERPSQKAEDTAKPTVIFCIRPLSDNHPGLNLHYLLPVSLRQRLGLGWRPPPERKELFIEAVARGIRVCAQEFGANVWLLPLWPGRDDETIQAAMQVAIQIGVPAPSIGIAEVEQTPARVAGYIGEADLLVSMRLHALIFAARQGVPVLALSYAHKVRGLMRMLDLERWVVEVETRNPLPEEIEMKMRQIWQAREQEADRLRRAAERALVRAEMDADEIAGVLMRKT